MVLSREKILDTAYEVLATYGLADLSMRRLAQELHVAPGALYYHVKNKQQLLILLADYILARAPKSMSEEAEPESGGYSHFDDSPRRYVVLPAVPDS